MPERFIQGFLNARWAQHLLFWMLSFYVLVRFFAYEAEISQTDVIYTFLFHISLVAAVYTNLLLLIPRLLQRHWYLSYLLAFVATLLAGAFLNQLTFKYLSDWLFPGFYFISYYAFSNLLQFVGVYLAATTLLKLSKSWFRLTEERKKISRLQEEKLQAELSALKAQVNPHFLFNSLNNLYSLSLDQDPQTPTIILKLAQSMRYMLHDSRADFVPLDKEIAYLEDYIELQKLRSDMNAKVEFDLQGTITNQQIAPLLLLPFVENGFKHGIKGTTKEQFIRILLDVKQKYLIFKMENNKGELDETLGHVSSGIGLQNVRRRLELQYPNQHELTITDGIEYYSVVLKLQLA